MSSPPQITWKKPTMLHDTSKNKQSFTRFSLDDIRWVAFRKIKNYNCVAISQQLGWEIDFNGMAACRVLFYT